MKSIYLFFTSISLYLLFLSFSCEEPCEVLFFDGASGGELLVSSEGALAGQHDVGETITFTASFSADQVTPNGESYRISEEGGLVVFEIFRIDSGEVVLELGLEDFAETTELGEVVSASDNDEQLLVRYRCPAQTCAFRQTFRAETAGSYVLRVTGSFIDEISAGFNYCEPPNLSGTTLMGGNNRFSGEIAGGFQLPVGSNINQFNQSFINATGEANSYFFTVE